MDLISISRKEGLEFAIRVRRHEVGSDFSEKGGGADRGPEPVELMVGALGACIGIMTQRYCDRHGYKDGEVSVSLTYEIADDPKRVSRITIDLEIPKDVPEERRVAIRRIAEKCPVHSTLSTPPEMDLEIL